MNLNKLTKAQLIEMINGLQDELAHIHEQQKEEEQPAAVQVQYNSHAEIMRERLAAAKAQAMSTGRAVKA